MELDREHEQYDRILDLIPDGILAVDRDLRITAINRTARRFLGVEEEMTLRGSPVSEIMDETRFARLRDGGISHSSEQIPSRTGNRRLECTFLGERDYAVYLCLIRDVTESFEQNELLQRSARRAAELADAMNEKHLRLVHDIAGLLGEDAAEMQIALCELKNTILPGEDKKNG
jgi:PAS domain S-box-containing protein